VTAAAFLVMNPASAGGRTHRNWPAIATALRSAGVPFDLHRTAAAGDATQAVRSALAGGYRTVVVVGGDGTLNEVVNGFFDREGVPIGGDAMLALLPSGTGGDFRRAVAIPAGLDAAARLIASRTSRRIDAGRVDFADGQRRFFVNIADCGVGGEVVARVNRGAGKRGGWRGTVVFLAVSMRVLTTFGSRPVRLTMGGGSMDLRIQNVVIANGRYFGGGMRIAPGAELDDGMFDVVVLPALGRFRTLLAVPSVYHGRHLRQPGVRVIRTSTVRVEPLDTRPLLFGIEGEQIGVAPATLTCLPGALRVCVE